MRCRKRLVEIQVHHVHAEVAGPRFAHQRIHVGAVHVEQRTLGVQHVGDLVDLAFEDSDRRWIGQHQRRRVFVDYLRQGRHIDAALRIRFQVHHLVAADSQRSRDWSRALSRE